MEERNKQKCNCSRNQVEYVINYNTIKDKTVDEVVKILSETEGIKLIDCRIVDLVFIHGDMQKPIDSGLGVYIFKTKERVFYVGSCTSRNFLERIPPHVDIRSSAWMNRLVKNMVKEEKSQLNVEQHDHEKKKQKGITYANESLLEASRKAFNECSLVMINFEGNFDGKNLEPEQYFNIVAVSWALEKYLLSEDGLKPINKSKRRWQYEQEITLTELLKDEVKANLVKVKKKKGKKYEEVYRRSQGVAAIFDYATG